MGTVYVNTTSDKIPIYSSNQYTTQIGTLYPNEIFTLTHFFNEAYRGDCTIIFRNSSGLPDQGVIDSGPGDKYILQDKKICGYALFTKQYNGKTYYGFKLRRDEAVYDGSKNYLFTAKAGLRFLCKDSSSGDTDGKLKRFQLLETGIGTNNYYEVIEGDSAYIDIGYNAGSTMTTNASFIGSL